MNHKGEKDMSTGEFFGKFVGIQGIAFILLIGGYIYMATQGIVAPEGYDIILSAAGGFFFAKNGGNVVSSVRNK
jgi:hypothetical protein